MAFRATAKGKVMKIETYVDDKTNDKRLRFSVWQGGRQMHQILAPAAGEYLEVKEDDEWEFKLDIVLTKSGYLMYFALEV